MYYCSKYVPYNFFRSYYSTAVEGLAGCQLTVQYCTVQVDGRFTCPEQLRNSGTVRRCRVGPCRVGNMWRWKILSSTQLVTVLVIDMLWDKADGM